MAKQTVKTSTTTTKISFNRPSQSSKNNAEISSSSKKSKRCSKCGRFLSGGGKS